ncbi:glycosyltransferase family 4 protein [Clostridium akagii]|uniref:glycosyltransferase family 4 protein n=1 Tax=Clostridium akagii TaxID=91623 RepID=UPI00047E55AD|nr:glycosyltransferase family 1 protein [Clostridium akagii]
MKIGIDARAAKLYRGTGIGTYTFQLINSLNKIDYKNNYLLFMPNSPGLDINFSKNFIINNIDEKDATTFWSSVNIPNILSGKDIDLYHVPQNGVGLPKDKKCPFIITLHDVIPIRMPETVSDKYLHIFNDELPKVLPLCDGIITVSEFSKQDISKAFNFPEEKIHVTYLGAEEIYRPLNKDLCRHIIEKYYGISDDFILYVGGFSPRKNIFGLLHGFSKLLSKSPKNLKLVIAGKRGESFKKYRELTEKLEITDNVIYPGFIPLEHMPYLYNCAKLFVYLSFYEGFGLPPIEAMACGVPVISSNVTSLPEVLKDSALFVNPASQDDICEALCNGLYNKPLIKNLILKGLLLSSELKWINTAKRTLEVYNDVVFSKNN